MEQRERTFGPIIARGEESGHEWTMRGRIGEDGAWHAIHDARGSGGGALPFQDVGRTKLGVDDSIFGRYEQAWRDERDEPFPGDEFAPTNEWGHVDFARRLGLHYPDQPDAGQPVTPSQDEISSAQAEWQGLPKRLDAPEPPPHPQATGKEIDFQSLPSGDDPF